jgi:ACT domain-containing protein
MAKKKEQICIVTVTGTDKVGIIAALANAMAKLNINIVDVNQKIMEDYFVMTMAAEISGATVSLEKIRKKLDEIAGKMSLQITMQDETIFKTMHRI